MRKNGIKNKSIKKLLIFITITIGVICGFGHWHIDKCAVGIRIITVYVSGVILTDVGRTNIRGNNVNFAK